MDETIEEPLGKKVDTVTIGKTRVTYAQAQDFYERSSFWTKNSKSRLWARQPLSREKVELFLKMTGPKAAVEATLKRPVVEASLSK